MRYEPLSKELYIRNRQKLYKTLKPGSVVILNSNDIMPTNADGTMPFRQNNDLLYLSGIDQEESILVLFPDAFRKQHGEMLFLRKTSPEIAIWEGKRLTKEEATAQSGIEEVHWLEDFDKLIHNVVPEAENIYLNSNEHLRSTNEVQTREERFMEWCKHEFPLHNYERLAPTMHRLRSVKEPEEIEQMKKACEITHQAFLDILNFVKPGVMEYEIEALLYHEFLRRGSRGPAYAPIIGSGFSACVLHYIDNNQECKDGDIILMDIGAEYGNYASDMTRCIPVNGRFTPRQKAVYNAVLRVMKQAMTFLRPGVYLDDYHKQVGETMEKELVDLGLLTMDDIKKQDPNNPAYKEFFMHGTSHFIGLDVHDVGLWHEPIQVGNAFTCEPGIYIREESLGIRLENDLIVQKDGVLDMMQQIPLEAEEIEERMNQ